MYLNLVPTLQLNRQMKNQKDASRLYQRIIQGIRYRTDLSQFRSDLSFFNIYR